MLISIVIPTRNRQELLSQTLFYLSKQKLADQIEMEVIVVDDGSTDPTPASVDGLRATFKRLEYIYRPRGENEPSCVSLIRNIGIQKSFGDVITFLDSGVLVPPSFVQDTAEKYIPFKNLILIHYTVGFFADLETDDLSFVSRLSPGNLLETIGPLLNSPAWADPREVYFDSTDDDLTRLSAPWTMGWSAALTVPKGLVEQVGGFDEAFTGWGAEDLDFCFRLHQQGAAFLATRDAIAFHLPHPTASPEEKAAANLNNIIKMHRKYYRFDTELFCFYRLMYFNQALARFNHQLSSDLIPKYPAEVLGQINEKFLAGTRHSLLVGWDQARTVQQLNASHIFVYNVGVLKTFQAIFKDRSVIYRLGSDTPYSDQYFDVVIVSDFIRTLGQSLRQGLLRELHRVSRSLIVLCTNDFVSKVKNIDDWPWIGLQELCNDVALMTKDPVTIRKLSGNFSVLSISTPLD